MKGAVTSFVLIIILSVIIVGIVSNYYKPLEKPRLTRTITGRAISDIPISAPDECKKYYCDSVCDAPKSECNSVGAGASYNTANPPAGSLVACDEVKSGGYPGSPSCATATSASIQSINQKCKSEGTCQNKCEEPYNGNDPCHCDTECIKYGDCYPDYANFCKTSVSNKAGQIDQATAVDEELSSNLMHSIDLSKGENIIGYPLDVETSVEQLKNHCPLESSNGYYIWTYSGDKYSWIPVDKLQPGKAYRVNSKEDCSILLFGDSANFEKLSLSKGWNLITSPKLSIFNNVLGACKGKLDDEQNVLGLGEETKNQLQKSVLEPGKAYWVFTKADCELDFSSNKPLYTAEGQIKETSFYSNALKENRKYNIYLPPSYYISSSRYPVLYLFHGAGGDNNVWIKKGDIDQHLKNLLQDGQITESIVIMPNIDQSALENGCSGFGVRPKDLAQRACGNYEDFIVNDLIPHVDSTYRTIADKSARGFLGFSTGAHGAYWIAFRHPQLVSFVAGYSGIYQEKSFIKGPLPFTSIDDYRSFREVKIPPKDEISHMTLYLEVGKYDLTASHQNEKFHERLKKAGIPHTYLVTPAGIAINQIYIHGEAFLRDNIDKAILSFSKEVAEPIKLVQYKVP